MYDIYLHIVYTHGYSTHAFVDLCKPAVYKISEIRMYLSTFELWATWKICIFVGRHSRVLCSIPRYMHTHRYQYSELANNVKQVDTISYYHLYFVKKHRWLKMNLRGDLVNKTLQIFRPGVFDCYADRGTESLLLDAYVLLGRGLDPPNDTTKPSLLAMQWDFLTVF